MYGELGHLINEGKLVPPKMDRRRMKDCASALDDAQNKHDRKQLFVME